MSPTPRVKALEAIATRADDLINLLGTPNVPVPESFNKEFTLLEVELYAFKSKYKLLAGAPRLLPAKPFIRQIIDHIGKLFMLAGDKLVNAYQDLEKLPADNPAYQKLGLMTKSVLRKAWLGFIYGFGPLSAFWFFFAVIPSITVLLIMVGVVFIAAVVVGELIAS